MKMTFGERVHFLRLAHGLTQEELAEKVGFTHKSSISKIEKNVNEVPLSVLVKIATILHTTPNFLLGWNEEESNSED